MAQTVAAIAFAALLASNMALNSFKVAGFPIRGLVACGVLLLAVLYYLDATRWAWRKNVLLLSLAAGLGVLGVAISVVNGTGGGIIWRELSETHVQAAVTILVASILARVAGPRACAIAIVVVIGVSTCVAVGQMLDVPGAWSLRRALGPLPKEATEGLNLSDRRPMGLSYSPIQLSTQMCLAFAAFAGVRDKLHRGIALGLQAGPNRRADPVAFLAVLVLFAACIASATRSPILGGLLFVAIYVVQRRTSWLPLAFAGAGLVLYFAWPLLMGVVETHAARITRADDDSASARITMAYYGLRLFLANPVGYGLGFAPMELWSKYWPELYMMPAPEGVRIFQLHNYVLSMLNIYGVGILLLAPAIFTLLRRARASLIFFVPYVVHILFHNAGPFFNDTVIWFVVAAIAAAGASARSPAEPVVVRKGGSPRTLDRLHPALRRSAESPGAFAR